jgi:hypothetical protein
MIIMTAILGCNDSLQQVHYDFDALMRAANSLLLLCHNVQVSGLFT